MQPQDGQHNAAHDPAATQHLHAQEDDHGHEHHDNHDEDHQHDHQKGFWGWLTGLVHWPGHHQGPSDLAADQAFVANSEGIRTVWLALAALGVTTLLQIIVVAWSGSVALLADTLHNVGDTLNSIPLLIAFYLARRQATRRYTYGFAKAEDVAGVLIVLSIAVSAGLIFWQSFQKFLYPTPITNLGWVAAAAVIGFIGNEIVALLQIRVGRRIGSAALVADGLHARTDGLTSLAVLLAVGGAWFGYPLLDPIVGILIGFTILFITWDATKRIWYRLMDAIEPEILRRAEAAIGQQADVKELRRLRMRWMGHRLYAEAHIAVDPALSLLQSHAIAEQVRHALFHQVERLTEAVIHVEPWSAQPAAHHQLTLHHEAAPKPIAD